MKAIYCKIYLTSLTTLRILWPNLKQCILVHRVHINRTTSSSSSLFWTSFLFLIFHQHGHHNLCCYVFELKTWLHSLSCCSSTRPCILHFFAVMCTYGIKFLSILIIRIIRIIYDHHRLVCQKKLFFSHYDQNYQIFAILIRMIIWASLPCLLSGSMILVSLLKELFRDEEARRELGKT